MMFNLSENVSAICGNLAVRIETEGVLVGGLTPHLVMMSRTPHGCLPGGGGSATKI
jgi:hypothetical protein